MDFNFEEFYSLGKSKETSSDIVKIKDYNELENRIRKLEFDIKYYLKILFEYKINNESLEEKLKNYVNLEEEYQEIKMKLKYENQKILENERKENEIIILRNENSSIKKEIENLEAMNKEYEIKNKEYKTKIDEYENKYKEYESKRTENENKIKDLEKDNENLAQKINDLEKALKETIEKSKIDNFKNFKNVMRIYYGKGNRNIPSYFLSKGKYIYFTHNHNSKNNTINSNNNIFTTTYSKKNKVNKNNGISTIKRDFNFMRLKRNNSLSALEGRDIEENNSVENYFQRQGNEEKDNKLFASYSNLNPFFPFSSKNSRYNGHILRKCIQKEFKINSKNKYINLESKF